MEPCRRLRRLDSDVLRVVVIALVDHRRGLLGAAEPGRHRGDEVGDRAERELDRAAGRAAAEVAAQLLARDREQVGAARRLRAEAVAAGDAGEERLLRELVGGVADPVREEPVDRSEVAREQRSPARLSPVRHAASSERSESIAPSWSDRTPASSAV